MPTQTPLTDQLNALTAYINTVTSGSDTCLSDAVETLADGYGQGGGGNVITIAEGTVAGTGTYEVEINLGSKAPLRDFYILLYAQNGQEFTYNTARNIAVMQYAIHSEISEMQFKQHVGGQNYDLYSPVGINQYTTNNDGTIITNTYKGDASKEVNLYQATATAQEELVYQVEFRKYTATGQWAMHLNRSNPSFVLPTYVTYKYKLVYFGNDPANDIDGWDGGTGGEDLLTTLLKRNLVTYENTEITQINTQYTFYRQPLLERVSFPNVTIIGYNSTTMNASSCFMLCPRLSHINFPKLETLENASGVFRECTALQTVVLPSYYQAFQGNCFYGCTNLEVIDLGRKTAPAYSGNNFSTFSSQFFRGCTNLATIIIRRTDAVPKLAQLTSLQSTPFDTGNAGGEIYIPKVLYDHLGDGTALDYKSATNWSTYDGYGTITWKQIEGSIYETQYADGTPIE